MYERKRTMLLLTDTLDILLRQVLLCIGLSAVDISMLLLARQ
ncbi:MAG: hypothetical protein QW450_01905 [Candidatus Nitrosocaldus sp.]